VPQVASDSTIQVANRPLPPVARPPVPDRPASPFETLLDATSPPASDPPPPPPPESKATPADNSRPRAKSDDAKPQSDDDASSPPPTNGAAADQQADEKAGASDDGKATATAKTNADAGEIVKSNGDDKSDGGQKKDKSDAATQIDATLTPPAPQVITTATAVPVSVAGTAGGGEAAEPVQAALAAETVAQLNHPGAAPPGTDASKGADNAKKVDVDDNAPSGPQILDDLTGNVQLAGKSNASHTGDKQQAGAGDADTQRAAQAHSEALTGSHAPLDASAPAAAHPGVDVNASSSQIASNALLQPATSSAPQQATDPTVMAANLASQQNPQAVAVPIAGVAVEIAGKALAGKNRFEIRLDPPELGRIEVRLDVDRDGNVTSRLTVDRQDTLNLLQRDASGLERALQDAGLKTADNGLQFSLRDQSMNQQQTGSGADTAQLLVKDETMPAIDIIPQSYGRLVGLGGGLDIRV